jgi:major capsid protein gp7
MAVTTLLDIAKANGTDPVVGLIDETSKAHPEITAVAARTIKGLSYRTWVRTSLPTSSFRNANTGVAATKSTYENRTVDTFILNPRFEVDKAVADRYEDGAAAYLAIEANAIMESSFQQLSKQFYYGRTVTNNGIGDPLGHPGLIDAYDSTNMVVDAGGTTANTGGSVWLVKFGPQWVQWVYGADGLLSVSEPMLQRVLDGSSNPYDAYCQSLLAYPGLQVGTTRGVCRIKKLTADSGKGLTDVLLSQAISKFQVGVVPDAIFMSRRSRQQLQASRTVTLFGQGGVKPSGGLATLAPIPTEYDGIPIMVTDAIQDTESLSL